MTNNKIKHKPPLICYLRRALVGASPSAIMARCTLGLRHGCPKCKGCRANAREAWTEYFKKGLDDGLRAQDLILDDTKKEDKQ